MKRKTQVEIGQRKFMILDKGLFDHERSILGTKEKLERPTKFFRTKTRASGCKSSKLSDLHFETRNAYFINSLSQYENPTVAVVPPGSFKYLQWDKLIETEIKRPEPRLIKSNSDQSSVILNLGAGNCLVNGKFLSLNISQETVVI